MNVVNGYVCKNCTEIDLAKKGIDPAHPKDGPYGRDKVSAEKKVAEKDAIREQSSKAATQPTQPTRPTQRATTGSVGRALDVQA